MTNQDTRRKPPSERAIKKSISLPNAMLNHAEGRARQRGFTAFSDYIQDLIRKDGFSLAA